MRKYQMVTAQQFGDFTMSTATLDPAPSGRALRAGLWAAQALIFFTFGAAGVVTLFTQSRSSPR